MNRKITILTFILIGFVKPQFSDAEISFDTRKINKSYSFLLNDLKKEIESYIERTGFFQHQQLPPWFSEEYMHLEIPPIKIHIVIDGIIKVNNLQTINAQFFASNNFDLNLYAKSCSFPYYKGQSINHSSDFDPLSSTIDYFAYIFLGNEIEMYTDFPNDLPLNGEQLFSIAENISADGRNSDFPNGWDERWKKVKKIVENTHLRKFRNHWYNIEYYYERFLYHSNSPNEDAVMKELILELENDIYYMKELFPNDRNVFLFLDIHAKAITKILRALEMHDALIMLANYDVNNREIYQNTSSQK